MQTVEERGKIALELLRALLAAIYGSGIESHQGNLDVFWRDCEEFLDDFIRPELREAMGLTVSNEAILEFVAEEKEIFARRMEEIDKE